MPTIPAPFEDDLTPTAAEQTAADAVRAYLDARDENPETETDEFAPSDPNAAEAYWEAIAGLSFLCSDNLPSLDAVNDITDVTNARTRQLGGQSRRAASQLVAADSIPGYEIVRRLSHGGQGVVYEATQEATKRRVAIKVLLEGANASDAARRRFEREIELVAQLKHPSIVTIFHSGETLQGAKFYVMDFVEGEPLHEYVRGRKLPLEQVLRLFCEVCDAVQYAHQRGIIHRDLKPTNILVDADGAPRVLDFGLAKLLSAPIEGEISAKQDVVGTLPFMSPEQARGDINEIDTRTDVYSLGVILYKLLSGGYPYPVAGPMPAVLRHICETEPTPPSKKWSRENGVVSRERWRLRKRDQPLDAEIDTIVLKSLAKERRRRYQSVGELQRDVQHYLAGEAIEAKRDTPLYVLRKMLQRHYAPVAVAAMFIAALIVFVLVMTLQAERYRLLARQFELAREWAMDQRRAANQRASELRKTVYGASILLAQNAAERYETGRLNAYLEQCEYRLRGWEWRRLKWLSDQSARQFYGHNGPVRGVEPTPDGRQVISIGGATDNSQAHVTVWDVESGQRVRTLRNGDERPTALALTGDGAQILVGGVRGTLSIWSRADGRLQSVQKVADVPITAIACSPNDACVAVADADGVLRIWNSETNSELVSISNDHGPTRDLCFSPDGARLLTCGGAPDSPEFSNCVHVWSTVDGALLLTLRGHERPVRAATFSPDGMQIASASEDKTVRIWDANDGRQLRAIPAHSAAVQAVAYSPDGEHLVSCGGDSTVRVWNLNGEEAVRTLRGHAGPVLDVAFLPSGSEIVSGGVDESVRLWNTEGAPTDPIFVGRQSRVRALALAPDFEHFATAFDAGDAEIWFADERDAVAPHATKADVRPLAFSPDSAALLASDGDGTLYLCDANSGAMVREWSGGETAILSAAYSSSGELIATGTIDGDIRVWRADDASLVADLAGATGPVFALAFADDETELAAAGEDRVARVWSLAESKPRLELRGYEAPILSIAFRPDGLRLATGDYNNTIVVWDTRYGEQLGVLHGHEGPVTAIVFSPDGERIISGSGDHTVKLWSADTFQELFSLRGHDSEVIKVDISDDGYKIISASDDNVVRVWLSGPKPPEIFRPPYPFRF